ncbi:DnaJ family domain-containing protein [Streptomyces cinnamoneus]|uniref:DUF1992 domain-containing protein n=1 Tax=Streptomyces cinnamoneus TaxID=53446 RepID=A0A918TC59_STRCJ|nr:DUF1992 domain-containing protein [Streptomyces cinnamoneus]GHC40018.1 DUF1992 domain-containing protein [Streptomyces cinnamoneus]
MSERERGVADFESWADRQIREAERRGDFRNLPGFGKPLPGIDQPYDEDWWIKAKMRRENISFLPPALVLRKEAEDAFAAAVAARTEGEARRIVGEINDKIAAALRRPPPGPALHLAPFDIDTVLAARRDQRRGGS